MSNFEESYKLLIQFEYSGKVELFLHKNKNEDSYTIGGVYQKHFPTVIEWDLVTRVVKMCKDNLQMASKLLFNDIKIQAQIATVFKNNFWDKNRLDKISQLKANKIFLATTNTGNKTAIKIVQEVCNSKCNRCLVEDGILGLKTILALNELEDKIFNEQFTEAMKDHYNSLIESNSDLSMYRSGWYSRAEVSV